MTTGAGEPALLEIDGVTIHRGAHLAVDRASFRVVRGSIHALAGPNGAGKSTLLSAILAQTMFEGRIVANWIGRGTIGYVPQSFAVDPTLPVTVEDFLALTRQRRPVCLGLSASTRTAIARLLDRAGIASLARRPLAALSGGELRRVLLAHALDPEPELLLLDEPNAGLDERAAVALDETLAALRRGGQTTVLMVSHDAARVRRTADRVTVLDRRVIADGRPDDVADLLSGAAVR